MQREDARIEISESKEMEGEDPKGLSKMSNRRSLDFPRRSMEAFTFLFSPASPMPSASNARTWPARARRYFDKETYTRHVKEVV